MLSDLLLGRVFSISVLEQWDGILRGFARDVPT